MVILQNVQNDTGKLATSVARERELSTKMIAELAKNIGMFKNTPMTVTAKEDPFVFPLTFRLVGVHQFHSYVANMLVVRQLHKQVRGSFLNLPIRSRPLGQRRKRTSEVHHHHATKFGPL